ncbi:SGNH/GDSL hydrolase family protein [Fimbriiglobus ruber]|uniref:O-antigen-like protein n=1 Tax=Fimbriiglobus ruber TaxID=1908690 RepID=A0A225E4D5_9BACT|nr:SGNH/GDSL hydrolase family protein [Fimbriiglobus ruber]OWK44349.1 O-antigen-like protein [Fimbriiglobus ruber]
MTFLSLFSAAFTCIAVAGLSPNVHPRGSLDNARIQFESGKGHVAFLGGSITEMDGFRPMVCDRLRKRLPKCEFTFTNAGIASTCSTTGAFRLASDVLAKGPVDLLFVEYAVNDDQDAGHARRECIRGLEGIVRHARAHNPNADIVVTFFVNEGMLKTIAEGRTPLTVAAHDAVAAHYGISSVDVAKETADRIAAKTLTWKEYGGVHPARPGNALAAELIGQVLDAAWKAPLRDGAAKTPAPLPSGPLDEGNYGHGRFIDPKTAVLASGWTLAPADWKKAPGQWRQRFRDIPLLTATEPGAELTLAFEGRAVGAYVVAGPDAGKVEASVDGGPAATVDLFHSFSRGLHYPRTVMFATDLKPGKHTLVLRMAKEKNAASTGTAARIVQFVAN